MLVALIAAAVVVPVTSKLPPTLRFFAIPTPPSTINAPVVVSVDCVASFKLTAPVTSKVPEAAMLVALIAAAEVIPVTFNVFDNVVAPVTDNVPSTVVVPVKVGLIALTTSPDPVVGVSVATSLELPT